jgi:hypothetical protein
VKKLIHAVLLLLGGLTLILSTSVAPARAGVLPFPGPEQDHNNATNSNATDQSAYANATTKQSNFNVPISVLSFASNNGDVKQSNDAATQANAENANATNQGAAGQQAWSWDGNNGNNGRNDGATNDNRTKQESGADAFTKQVNVNAPISVLSYGSNNGNVDQSNQAYTDSNAENDNSTTQNTGEQHQPPKHDEGKRCEGPNQKDHNQNGYGQKGHDQAESGSNSNDTHQRAYADAYTKQKNFNAPVSILSFASNNGNVNQSNKAYTNANAENLNSTYQKAEGRDGQPANDYGRDGSNFFKDGGKQLNSPSNENRTDQHANAKAKSEQKNVNFPISFLSFGSNNGNVQQHNSAVTQAFAGNGNWTGQWAGPVFGNG